MTLLDEHFWGVDRIEGNKVVMVGPGLVEQCRARSSLPPGVREGSVLRVPVVDGLEIWERALLDLTEEERRRIAAEADIRSLTDDNSVGDVDLRRRPS
jgi:hypothetical protein